jgi:hypothetical protein
MPVEFPMNEPQKIWQDQPTEVFTMSEDQLCRKAQQFQRRARLEAIYSMILGLLLATFFAWTVAKGHEVIPRLGYGVVSLWCIFFAFQSSKWVRQERMAPDANLKTTVQAYRSELEKRRDYGRHLWRKAGLTFVFLGMGMVLLPSLLKSFENPRLLLTFAPIFVLLALWIAIFIPTRRRRQRKLQREIDELCAFES